MGATMSRSPFSSWTSFWLVSWSFQKSGLAWSSSISWKRVSLVG